MTYPGTSPGTYAFPGPAATLASLFPGDPVEYDTRFYVGPIGGLRPLPDTAEAVDTPLAVIGGTHTSLTGTRTRDTFGYKRSWVWSYGLLTDNQAKHIEALQRNIIPGPLYLLDPRRPNRLPEQIASGGSLLRTPAGFIPSNTSVCRWRPLTGVPASAETLPPAPLLRGALDWQLLTNADAHLELAGGSADGRHDVPVRGGEALTASLWAAGTPGAPLGGTVSIFDTRGTEIDAAEFSSVQLSFTEWQRLLVSFVCPASAAYLRIKLTVISGTQPVTGSIYTTAYQVAPSSRSYVSGLHSYCDDTDLGQGWSLGGGCVQVIPDGGGGGYVLPGLQSSGLTLMER